MFQGSIPDYSRFIAVLLAASCVASSWADWPQFQGPDRNGISRDTGLARSWPAGGPELLWSVPLGEGFAGPAIRDGEVYLLDRVGSRQDILRCFSLYTGEELWRFAYNAPGSTPYNGSRTTPTVTETHVYTVGLAGDLYCVDRATHRPVWHRNIYSEFRQPVEVKWGIAQSPSIYKDLVIVAPQSPEAGVAAFDSKTGDLVWASESTGGLGYSTPVIVNLAGMDQVVMVSASNGGAGGVAGISPQDGTVLWKYEGWQCRIAIPYPTLIPNDRLFLTGEYGAGSAMIRVHRETGRFRVEELFTTKVVGSQIHQPLLYENHLYMNSNGNQRNDGMACLTLDGELVWRTRDTRGLPRFERGNLLMVDDMIINFDGRRGILHLIEPSPEGYRELSRAQVFDGTIMWAPMAVSRGRLVLRSQWEMKCLDLGGS